METLWFILVALMLTAYVVLDGFDIGAGIIYLVIGKTNRERRLVLRTIGPVWDGNEVWLLAAGGTLYFAFPLLYASSFSGFYLPLMMVLWLLILRAVGIEFRAHIDNSVWQSFFDGVFSLSSVLLAVFFGAALGNVIRGVPLGPDGYFFEPLWTTWKIGPYPGILDWYTVVAGVIALTALAVHGGLYVATKTEDALNARARGVVVLLLPLLFLLTCASLVATISVRPQVLGNYKAHPVSFVIPIIVFGCLGAMPWAARNGKDRLAFAASSLYLGGMLVGAAFGLYPDVLPATTRPAYSLTIYNTAAGRHGLMVGLVWWTVAMILTLSYFVFLYRRFRGKVGLEAADEGY
ncbi:MAG TPA: cytochrome d ubiquinol oxidase subunit II [Terriglobales bacterium]|jgi:cytochrome d ubiquinol oxidase subunit II|nr:cytochrome d ubiquinol oxidase subunit II [Terriglobales bacterium]